MLDAKARTVCPVTHRLLDRDRAVAEATPRIGVTKVGEVCRTFSPLPVLAVTYKAPAEVDWTLPAPRLAMVVEPLGKTENKLLPVEEATVNRLAIEVVTVPWTVNNPCGVVVPMPTFPPWVTLSMDVPEEELTLKGSKVVVPWTLKLTVEEVALTPTTVPLLSREEAEVKPLAEVQ